MMLTNNKPEIETTIALVQKDLANFSQLFEKLDITVEKISEANNNVSKLLSLHDQRLEVLYQNDKILELKLEKNAGSFVEDMKELHTHIRTNNRDVLEMLKSSENSIKNEIKHMREALDRENKTLRETMEMENLSLKTSITDLDKTIVSNQVRITALERWRYLFGGATLVVIWLLNKSPISLSILT